MKPASTTERRIMPLQFFIIPRGIPGVAGFIFSGNVGTGVVIANKYDGTWSAPSAIGLAGIRFGFMVGAEVKDIVMCVMDDTTLDTLSVSYLLL